MTSPAIAKPRGVLKIPTNEKIKPKAHNTQPSPGTQLKIKPNKATNKTGGSQSVRASPLLLIDNDRLPFDLMSADFISILLRNIIHKI